LDWPRLVLLLCFCFYFSPAVLLFRFHCFSLCSLGLSLGGLPPVFFFFFLFFGYTPSLPFISSPDAYLSRTMIRPRDIVFRSNWGTNSPAHARLLVAVSSACWRSRGGGGMAAKTGSCSWYSFHCLVWQNFPLQVASTTSRRRRRRNSTFETVSFQGENGKLQFGP